MDNKYRPSRSKFIQIQPLYYENSGNKVSLICSMYHFLSEVKQTLTLHHSPIPIPEHDTFGPDFSN